VLDPLSVCLAAVSPVLSAILSPKDVIAGVLGNRADAILVGGARFLRKRLLDLPTEDPALNHDLERGTREAYLVATLELIEQALLRGEAARGQLMSAGLDDALTQVKRAITIDLENVADTLPRPLDDPHLFLLDSDAAPAAGSNRLRDTLRRNLADDFSRWLPGRAIPTVVEELLRDGWMISTSHHKNVRRDWYSLIGIAFVEKLKTTPRLATVFESRLLAQIAAREPAAAPIASFAGFQAKFGELTVPLQRIEDSLGVLHRRIDDVHRDVVDIKADVREVRDAARGFGRIPRMMWASAALLALAATGVLATEAGARAACSVPGVRAVCARSGIGGVPTAEEELLWQSRARGDCSVLQTYVTRFPRGAYAEEAGRRLAAKTSDKNVTWKPAENSLGAVIAATSHSFATEQEARADAVSRAGQDARDVACLGYDNPNGEFRLRSARAVPVTWDCRQRANGVACSLAYKAVCEVDVKHDAGYCE
jgi:hypothetical protein